MRTGEAPPAADARAVGLEQQLRETREHQAALAEVLAAISTISSDAAPVFETIVRQAVRLCSADYAVLWRAEGGSGVCEASFGSDPRVPKVGDRAEPERMLPARRIISGEDLVHIPDLSKEPDRTSAGTTFPTRLGVAIRIDGDLWGWMNLVRATVRPFGDGEIDLVRTFAQQAALALKNVRLFNETKEALERQTATSQVLRVMSTSPTQLQPVLDAIAESALTFCGAEDIVIRLIDGPDLIRVAHAGPVDVRAGDLRMPLTASTLAARAVAEGREVVVDDMQTSDEFPLGREIAIATGFHTGLAVPLRREGRSIGSFLLRRRERRPFTAAQIELVRTFADQAVIAIENVRLFNETKESLEHQKAISDVLAVISTSTADPGPALGVVVDRAASLCNARRAALFLLGSDGKLHIAADHDADPAAVEHYRANPAPAERTSLSGRAVLDRRTVHIADHLADPDYRMSNATPAMSSPNSGLGVPLIHEDRVLGALVLWRPYAPYRPEEIRLVETFAAQAAIAIENVRLFNETKGSLQRQTATAGILRAIAGSPTDVQPVLDAIATSARRFCQAEDVIVALLRDGALHLDAHDGAIEGPRPYSWPADRTSVTGRAVVEGRTVHVADLLADESRIEYPIGHEQARLFGHRTTLATPLMREGVAIGAILVRRKQVRDFTEQEVDLVQTFADQAVIAIENVRLFNETREALERQTAIGEILRVISQSPTDVQPVLDAIASSARRFCAAEDALVMLQEGTELRSAAHAGDISTPPGGFAYPIDRRSMTGRSFLDRETVHVADMLTPDVAAAYPLGHELAKRHGWRTAAVTPLLREGRSIGTINLRRMSVRPFTDRQLDLLRTFASQAVIAIENVRLFNETKEALEQQTAVASVLDSIARARSDPQPVFDVIVERARQLAQVESVQVFVRDATSGDYRPRAFVSPSAEAEFWQRFAAPFRADGPGSRARAVRERLRIHTPDILADAAGSESLVTAAHEVGIRSALSIPLVREDDDVIGLLTLQGRRAGAFGPAVISTLETFAAQAVIALENTRLFNETKESLDQQTAIADILRVMTSSPTETQPIFDAIAQSATKFAAAEDAAVMLVQNDELRTVSHHGPIALPLSVPVGPDSVSGRAVLEVRTVHAADVTASDEFPRSKRVGLEDGQRTVLSAPLVRGGKALGVILLRRTEARPFTERQVQLAQTFADQAAIAIENVRLFKETQEKSQQLEVASRHKSEFLANMSHELRTPLNAIIGFTDVMLQEMFGPLNEKQKEYLGDVRSSGNHLLTLINDILDLSKIEAGRVDLEVAAFSLAEAIDNALTLVRERAARHGIAIASEVAPEVGMIEADQRKLKQILVNLLSNAVKFTPDGGSVGITAKCDGEHVDVAVRDTGIGIAADDRTRVFEEFQQVGKDPERSREGTGLGLALAKRYVELHGGRIWVESEVGRGSTFTFTIPVRQTAAGAKG
jgi:GAF domain-containing protein